MGDIIVLRSLERFRCKTYNWYRECIEADITWFYLEFRDMWE